ncbi:MAG: hypothetical protein IJZ42_05340 [Lachnospiraceae bacterium]|nr:hypothetical protein [Lachnospiraceae bacterium]
MKYRNAADVFPDELLKEIQKYASGETIYIPSESKRKPWGGTTGARNFYEQRNAEIRKKYYQDHQAIKSLAEEYGLSEETIRKVLYK